MKRKNLLAVMSCVPAIAVVISLSTSCGGKENEDKEPKISFTLSDNKELSYIVTPHPTNPDLLDNANDGPYDYLWWCDWLYHLK